MVSPDASTREKATYETDRFVAVPGVSSIETGRAADGYYTVRIPGHQWDFERQTDADDLVAGLCDVFEVAAGRRSADPSWGGRGAKETEVPGVKRKLSKKGWTQIYIGARGFLSWESEDDVQRTLGALAELARAAKG